MEPAKRDKKGLVRLIVWFLSMYLSMWGAVKLTEKFLGGNLIAEIAITVVFYCLWQGVIILVLSLKNKTSFKEEMKNWPQEDPAQQESRKGKW